MPEAGMERMEKIRATLEAALSVKAEKPVVLDVREVSSFADTFVLVSGRSDRQVRSIADRIERRLRGVGERPLGIEGTENGRWILMDFADLIVHVFLAEVRELYDLERLWSDAPQIDAGIELDASESLGAP